MIKSQSSHIFSPNRQYFNEKTISEKYTFRDVESDNVIRNTKNFIKKNYKPSKLCCRRFFKLRFPLFAWLKVYNIKNNLLNDIIGGLTIGLIEIPQSMGYSLMAGLPAVNGLYVSFFSALTYFFFGTSRHLSIGTYGIVALMLEGYLDNLDGKLYTTQPLNNVKNATIPSNKLNSLDISDYLSSGFISDDPNEAKIMIATSFAFYVGIFQVAFGLFHGGVATKYLSETIISAFTTGAAYHVVVSELHSLLGIKVDYDYSFFKLIKLLIELFNKIETINYATIIISVVCIFELYSVKHFINHKYKDKMIAPVPIELIVITLGTLFSYLFRFEANFNVEIIGEIPLGIPQPKLPPFSIFPFIFVNVLEIASVSYALNIAMAKIFAKKYKYEIRPNQESLAYGLGNFIVSFFNGFPSSVGISRCVILDDIGVKSLLHTFISSIVVLIVIVAVGFLIKCLPIACLASLIVVALFPMLTQIKQVVPIFKRSKIEGFAWLTTFLGVILLDVDFGLYIGIAFSLYLFIFQNQRAYSFVMGNIPNTDMYEAINLCDEALEIEGIKIIRYESSLFYANVDNFKYKIVKLSGVNPNLVIAEINQTKHDISKLIKSKNKQNKKLIWTLKKIVSSKVSTISETIRSTNVSEQAQTENKSTVQTLKSNLLDIEIEKILSRIKISDIIIDFSCVNVIDPMGVDAIVELNEAYKECGVQLHLSHCKRSLLKKFSKQPLALSNDFIYPTTHDAVLHILNLRKPESSDLVESDFGSINLDFESNNGSYTNTNVSNEFVEIDINVDPSYYLNKSYNKIKF